MLLVLNVCGFLILLGTVVSRVMSEAGAVSLIWKNVVCELTKGTVLRARTKLPVKDGRSVDTV